MFGQFLKGKGAFDEALDELLEGEKYSFGEPWQISSGSLSAIVPILKNSVESREYLVAQEISANKICVVDSGQIGKLKVSIVDVEKPIFVRAGTIFKGQGTQSRSVGTGICIEPDGENLVDVFCVHASHGISTGSRFSVEKDIAPRKVEDVLSSPYKNQARVWEAASLSKMRAQISHCPECGSERLVQSYEAELVCTACGFVAPAVSNMSHSGRSFHPAFNKFSDDMVRNLGEMNEFNKKIDDMLSKVPADLKSQVGMVMIDSKGVHGLEMFDHPDSWSAFSKSIVRNYADVLARERAGDGLFELKVQRIPEAIKEFLRKARAINENSVFRNKIGETLALSGQLIGEYSVLGRNLVHLMLKRNDAADRQ